jgi:ribosome-associated heat shock protein Hsp15
MDSDVLRVDKWLWQARFFKSRALASRVCIEGRVRVNGGRITKAHMAVRPGDVLTFPAGRHIRVVRVRLLGTRRGPAAEAATLFEDLDPPSVPVTRPRSATLPAGRDAGAGRPTKADRRAIDRLRGN